MPTTSPDGIFWPDGPTQYGDATNEASQASSIQTALNKRQQYTYIWTDASFRASQAGMRNGDTGYQQDTQVLYTYDGTQWNVSGTSPWTSWTPTTANFSVGTTGASLVTLYRYVGRKVEVKIAAKLGTGSSMGTNPLLSLPVPSEPILAPYTAYNGVGSAYIGGSVFPLFIVANSTSATDILFYALAPTTSGFTNVSSTVPATWASGSAFSLQFSYLPA